MEFFDRIIDEIRLASKYFKARTKEKYYGDRFEEWVVCNANITSNEEKYKGFWKLLDWRGDKFINGIYPISNASPDLLLQKNEKESYYYKPKSIIAVECKWREKENIFISKDAVERYHKFIEESPLEIEAFFYVFGIGWKNNQPKKVYVIPHNEFYTYDKKEIIFSFNKVNKAKKLEAFLIKDFSRPITFVPKK